MKLPDTLLARTGLTIALALLAFVLFTGFLVFHYILMPVGRQAADDLAALVVLSARTWVELPPDTRPDFVDELKQNHQLRLLEQPPSRTMEPLHYSSPYMRFLKQALKERLGIEEALYQVPGETETYWIIIPVADRQLYLGFSHDRIGARPPAALLGILVGAGLFILVTLLLLVRFINRPLSQLTGAVQQLGRRGFSRPLAEEGPRELALLARKFNELSREVQQLLDNRTTLLGGISHDLRTPLARLRIALELMEGKEEARLLLQMRSDLEEMNQIVGRTLELAGLMQTGEKNPDSSDVCALLREMASEHSRHGKVIQLRLAGCGARRVPTLAFRRIVGNLLENSFHHGGDGEVAVTLEETGGTLLVCVLDRGPGIPDQDLEKVFQPFHRLEPSRSRATGGSGLGLAIAKQLADLEGWKITLRNREEGGLTACLQINPAEY